jgi:hypothetical protein
MIMRDEMFLTIVRASIVLFIGGMMPFAAGGKLSPKCSQQWRLLPGWSPPTGHSTTFPNHECGSAKTKKT